MEEIGWGIIGCGDVTEVKSGPAFDEIDGSKLVSVMRRNAEKAEDYARRHNVPKWTADAEALISDPAVDAVYIATPPDSHADYVVKVAEAGKPAYVEKPMARTYAECQRMVDACEQGRVPLFVAYYRRALPAFVRIKELVHSSAVGEVRFIAINMQHPLPWQKSPQPDDLPWRVLPEIAGGGYFFDLASHQLDYLDFVFGPIKTALGLAANQAGQYPAEDIVVASFEFESGVLGTGTWCFTVSPAVRKEEVEIVGSKGEIRFSTFQDVPVQLLTESGVEEFHLPPPQHIQRPLIQTVVDELRGLGECPSTGASAARTARIMDEIVRDWRHQRRN